jgi:hypothetical protein
VTQQPYLNLGAGKIIYPGEPHWSHGMVNQAIFQYPLWHNIDRNAGDGIDECINLFTYPWPLQSDSYDGALLSHLCEHIPHKISIHEPERLMATAGYIPSDRARLLMQMQDGWYAFFAELYRVLTDGAMVHILAPYGWSQGAITDPTHTRLLTEHTFTHSMKPDPDNVSFQYANGGIHFDLAEPVTFKPTELFAHLLDDQAEWTRALQTRLNVVYEFYTKLRVVK